MSTLSSFTFSTSEILRTNKPVPVQSVKPSFDKNRNITGCVVTVILPERSWAVLSVKIPDTAPLQLIGADVPLTATFENLAAKPYAMLDKRAAYVPGCLRRRTQLSCGRVRASNDIIFFFHKIVVARECHHEKVGCLQRRFGGADSCRVGTGAYRPALASGCGTGCPLVSCGKGQVYRGSAKAGILPSAIPHQQPPKCPKFYSMVIRQTAA